MSSNKMLMSKVADPYASALLNSASSTNTLDTITSDINDLLELFDSIDESCWLLYVIQCIRKVQKRGLRKSHCSLVLLMENTVRFLMALLDRSRIDLLESIAEKYCKWFMILLKLKLPKFHLQLHYHQNKN